MSMVDSEWGSALTRPSSTASSAAIMLGVWVITLTVVTVSYTHLTLPTNREV